ncbi:hypothetical protein Ahu01nite_075760 [Winogradskya humida]|uniref:FAD-binding FR-type domain-containing protein n=1 Tax=Winogradskya humida TaxID=113566 RepID=A0ABQ4A196_9ACTN|nr:hypothetical protein Ahu01nite_075760 [Actinoplanes humidus]
MVTRPAFIPLSRLVPPARTVGPAGVMVLAGVFGVVWLVCRPAGVGWGSFLGQLVGAEAVLLMAVAIVLISVLPAVETWFDGIDKAAIWHRRLSITGLLLLIPHLLFAQGDRPSGPVGQTGPPPEGHGSGMGGLLAQIGIWGLAALALWAMLPRWRSLLSWLPPDVLRRVDRLGTTVVARRTAAIGRLVLGGYERWRSLHRLTGLLLAAGFVHGLLDATTFGSPVLRWSYLAVGGTGLVFYVYRETAARFFLPLHDYQVTTVTPVARGLTEVTLTPVGRPLHFVPGQFAMLFLEGRHGWRRHPFTISGAPSGGELRFSIKALGDDTHAIQESVAPGMPAVIGGPHGRFAHTRGTARQLWIAGGIGVTPFLSWLRSHDTHHVGARIDFFYTTAGPAPFADEIAALAAGVPHLRLHLHDSSTSGYLSADAALTAIADDDPRQVSVFLCGPEPMVNAFIQSLRTAGIARRNLHREHFDWR